MIDTRWVLHVYLYIYIYKFSRINWVRCIPIVQGSVSYRLTDWLTNKSISALLFISQPCIPSHCFSLSPSHAVAPTKWGTRTALRDAPGLRFYDRRVQTPIMKRDGRSRLKSDTLPPHLSKSLNSKLKINWPSNQSMSLLPEQSIRSRFSEQYRPRASPMYQILRLRSNLCNSLAS